MNAEADGRKPRADAVRNRERLMDVAKQAFAEIGPDVSLEEIARRAGVGIGTLYRHFPTKEALYEAIVVIRIDDVIAAADDFLLDTDTEPGAALDAFLREFARQAADKQDLFEALGQAGIDIKARFSDRVDELMARIDVLRQRAVDAKAIRGDVQTQDILNLVMGTCHAAGHSGSDDEALQRCVSIVLAGLQPTSSI